jgi:hypothetical protein
MCYAVVIEAAARPWPARALREKPSADVRKLIGGVHPLIADAAKSAKKEEG